MDTNYANIPLRHDADAMRFEIEIDGKKAFMDYYRDGDVYALNHTEADAALQGKGAAGALVEKVMHYLKDQNANIVAVCPYIVSYLKRHPELNPNN